MTYAFVKIKKQGDMITGFFINTATGQPVPVNGTILQTTTMALLAKGGFQIIKGPAARPYIEAQGLPVKPPRKKKLEVAELPGEEEAQQLAEQLEEPAIVPQIIEPTVIKRTTREIQTKYEIPGGMIMKTVEIPGFGIPIRAESKQRKEKTASTTREAKPVTTTKKASAVTGAQLNDLQRFTGKLPTLQGLTLYITGSHPDYTKEQLEAMVTAKGGIFKSPSGKTKLLVVGDKPGQTRIDKAKEFNIPWMPLDEFMQYL